MPDKFDVFLQFERDKHAHGNEPEQIEDYPETVVGTLRIFNKVWCPPPMAIPTKRQSSKFKQWIKDLAYLENLCGTNAVFEKVLKRAVATYREKNYSFVVDSPIKFKNMIITELAKIRQDKNAETVSEAPVVVTEDGKKKALNTIKNLRESLEQENT